MPIITHFVISCRQLFAITIAHPWNIGLLSFLYFILVFSTVADANISNRLHRVEIRPKSGYTRLSLELQDFTPSTVALLPGNRLRITITNTNGPLFKKYRRYSDRNIGGLVFKQRGDELLVTFQIARGTGWRSYNFEGIGNITIDIGQQFAILPVLQPLHGREKIQSGIGKLVRDFDPPLKTDIPFTPTDRQLLAKLLPPEEQQLFSSGEAALYKGRFTEAEEIITPFSARQTPIKALALYRMGEIAYHLQKYPQALGAFREAEKLWPAFLTMDPGVTFFYGDSIVRSGDLDHGRELLAGLIARLSDKKFAPTLLVRLGDIYSRHGHDQQANALYRIVADNFNGNKARQMALLRLNDQLFMASGNGNYRPLSRSYLEISEQIGDFDMREEAHFKHILLEALHADTISALQDVLKFQRKFPRGAYATVTRSIREALVAQVYTENDWNSDSSALIRFVEEQQEYLADAVELPGFLTTVSKSYELSGRPIERIRFLSFIVDRQWATTSAPRLYEEIAENADMIGDTAFATKTLRTLLRKYPSNPRKQLVTENLGALLFNDGKYLDVKNTLSSLLQKKERAQKSESYYFLGKSLWNLNEYHSSIKAFDLFLSVAQSESRYLSDTYYVAASAREAVGDRKGASKLLDLGLSLPINKNNEAMLYKAGQINIVAGNRQKGKAYLEQVVQNGKDQDWKRLAQQALDSAGFSKEKQIK